MATLQLVWLVEEEREDFLGDRACLFQCLEERGASLDVQFLQRAAGKGLATPQACPLKHFSNDEISKGS